jgi:Transposase DDE domain
MLENELIALYCYFCECYNTELRWFNQRFSNNSSPSNEKLTDEEILTIYFYCRRYENKHLKSEIWDFANRFMRSWFPKLPAYANFNHRINNLSSALVALVTKQLDDLKSIDIQSINEEISLVDSLPIMLCSGKRQGKVAPEISDKTFCATKGIYYFGVKLHIVAFQRPKKLPLPEFLSVTSASEFDLTALRPILPKLVNRAIFADKAYADQPLNEQLMKDTNTYIYTPVKLIKGETQTVRQFKNAADELFSTAVSRVRQPIESLFNYLIEKTDIQYAAKVRATNGLNTHIFGSIATALLFWLF